MWLKKTRLQRPFSGLVFISALLFWSACHSTDLSDDTYDVLLKAYSEKYLPYNWYWTKAQTWQESRFDPRARSPVGAQGLMQIMPATALEIQRRTGLEGPLTNPKINIFYGTYYMNRMMKIWYAKRTTNERRKLAMASYNAGAGHIINSQKRCNNQSLWDDIKVCLPQITGNHSKETITYVDRIDRWHGELVCRM